MKSINFKAGEYIVLLHSCLTDNDWPDHMPVNYVYQLKKDMDILHFFPEIDIIGSITNGWTSISDTNCNKMDARLATQEEIQAYQKAGRPVPAINTQTYSYEIF